MISITNSIWIPGTNSILQGLMLGPGLFNIFIDEPDDGKEYTLRHFADDAKLGGVASPDGYAVIQNDFYKLVKWANRYLMNFYKRKYQVSHLGKNNPRHEDRL